MGKLPKEVQLSRIGRSWGFEMVTKGLCSSHHYESISESLASSFTFDIEQGHQKKPCRIFREPRQGIKVEKNQVEKRLTDDD